MHPISIECGVDGAFRRQPRLAHRSPPRSFFGECILQGAIDFAEMRERSWRRGRLCTYLSLTFSRLLDAKPAYHIAAHHAAFSTSAICKLQLILRCCGRRSWRRGVGMRGAGCRTFFGVAGFAPKLNF